ncbi:MAG: phage holin family protein [Muribaculaceae bacterium]|nr:phage holin family protein [Muribaculaceae bacterium]
MSDANSLYTTVIATIGAVLTEFYTHLAPWLLLGAVLVFVDLRFGLMAARKRGENIRPSRAIRRTINKMIDYLCWVTLAEVCSMTFDVTFGVPVVTIAILLIIYGIELNSCVNNYLEYKGVKKRLNFFKLVGREDLLENGSSRDINDKNDSPKI